MATLIVRWLASTRGPGASIVTVAEFFVATFPLIDLFVGGERRVGVL